MASIGQNEDDWDDSVIYKVFQDSLKKHVTQSFQDGKKLIAADKVAAKERAEPVQTTTTTTIPLTTTTTTTSAQKRQRKEVSATNKKGKAVGFSAALANYIAAQPNGDEVSVGPSVAQPSVANSAEFEPTNNVPPVNAAESNETSYSHNYQNHFYQPCPTAPVANVTSGMIDEALQTMLMAWYQSGYATGRYQTLCELSGYHTANPLPVCDPLVQTTNQNQR
jgi:hypothetical protein